MPSPQSEKRPSGATAEIIRAATRRSYIIRVRAGMVVGAVWLIFIVAEFFGIVDRLNPQHAHSNWHQLALYVPLLVALALVAPEAFKLVTDFALKFMAYVRRPKNGGA